ncbi:bombesin receptor subtype-3-like [Amphiura filiformis]|uniref:bombesin receptor subtype-3-like n=1 Tax=Amphiura filiformis TaxID=82378 RepID=UPI003B21EB55
MDSSANTTSFNITENGFNTQFSEEEWRQFFYQTICATRESFKARMVIYVLFVLFGVIGNIALLFIILKDKHLRNSPNILISNLALADLMYILIVGPIRIEHEIHPCWLRGALSCALKNYTPVVCQCACVYSLVALSRERYSAVVTGIKAHMSKSTKLTLCWAVAAWILGVIFASPILTDKFSYISHEVLCSSVKRGSFQGQFYEVTKVLMLYFIPVTIIAVHYSIMARALLQSTTTFNTNSSQFVKQVNARKRLAYLSITLSVFFIMFWFPNYVYTLTYHFKPPDEWDFSDSFFIFRQVQYFMSLANSSLNPWLVFILSSSHRRRLMDWLGFTRAARVISEYRERLREARPQHVTMQYVVSGVSENGGKEHTDSIEL